MSHRCSMFRGFVLRFVVRSDSATYLGFLSKTRPGGKCNRYATGELETIEVTTHTLLSMPTLLFRCACPLWLVVFLVFTAGCERRDIEVYSVDKEITVGSSPPPAAAGVRLPDVPDGSWQAIDPAGGPRLASFRIGGSDGSEDAADLGVTVFPGTAGGLLANVNRWRNEMAQPPLGEEELAEALREIEVAGHTIHLVDAATAERRTLGAILPLASETWFFKLTGPIAVVGEQEATLLSYLRALEISGSPGSAPSDGEAAPEQPRITYVTPSGWIESEGSAMRAASFSISDGSDGREADVSVIPLGGSGGAQLAIVNQWRATLRLDDATGEQLPGMIEDVDVGGRPFQVVDIESEVAMLDGDRKARILVAFTTLGEHTWFFKIAGESSLVAEQRAVLLEFLKSVDFPTP